MEDLTLTGLLAHARRLETLWPVLDAQMRATARFTNDGTDPAAPGTVNIDAPITIQSLEARQEAIRGRMAEINSEFASQALPDDVRSEWNALGAERERNKGLLDELRARTEVLRSMAAREDAREAGATFHTASPTRGEDPFDYSHIRGATSLEGQRSLLRDQALRAVEATRFESSYRSQADCRASAERLIRRSDDEHGTLARRVLNTGSAVYQRAFGRAIAGAPLTNEEQRALGLTNTAGGYAIPFQLDPTIIHTSNGAVNPYRRIARVIQIVGTTWQGVTSAGVTATRRSEADEAADNSPTLAQPSVTPQRVDVFIPFSMEVGQDWSGMQGEMTDMISDAKDEEEAASFTTGTGTPPAAEGIVTGATTTVTATGTASFAVGDLYKVEEALPARFRPLAQWVASRTIYNKARQFDTAGGANIWTQSLRDGLANNPVGNTGYDLIGYPANEASSMATALTTGQKIGVLGDFRHFAIVDRIGMDIELIPHLFGSNRRPTGQRGIFAVWRNNSEVLVPGAFRTLVTG
jgi:HK97 family phage major capsid protein